MPDRIVSTGFPLEATSVNSTAHPSSGWKTVRRRLSIVLRWLLGITAIIWVLWGIDWEALFSSFQHIQLGWVVAAIGSFMLSLVLKLVRWRLLLFGLAHEISWLKLARALFLGQAVNIVGVGRLGEVARVLLFRRESGLSGIGLATTVVAEKALDLVLIGLAGVWWLFVALSPPSGIQITHAVILGLASLLALGLFARWGGPVLKYIQGRLADSSTPLLGWLAQRIDSLSAGLASLTRWPGLGLCLGFSALIWGVMTLTDLLLLGAFKLPFAFPLALSVVVWGHIGVAANLTPANIGIHHWAITFGLTLFDVPRSTALAYALVLHTFVTVLPVVIAVVLNGWAWPDLKITDNALAK
jgi:uncharacterized membrane protein YbhN (UPF0104 family)